MLKVKEEIWWDGTRLTEAQEAERWTLTTGEKLDLCGKDRSRATPQDFFEVAPVRDKESTLEKPLILLAVFPDTLIADRNAAYQRYLATAKADPARSQAGRRDIIGDPVLFAEWAELESSLLDLQIAETTARAIREREAKRGA
ncbi:hypothetical protein EON81_09965 [bacterium]|nr:MAG: hypothetical protein EON81_09965 [bacterium]